MTEDVARSYVEDIINAIPVSNRNVTCGDFNTRLANDSPCIKGITLERCSLDKFKCSRSKWLINLCTVHSIHVLNGV